jgi:hypothetical protein
MDANYYIKAVSILLYAEYKYLFVDREGLICFSYNRGKQKISLRKLQVHSCTVREVKQR